MSFATEVEVETEAEVQVEIEVDTVRHSAGPQNVGAQISPLDPQGIQYMSTF